MQRSDQIIVAQLGARMHYAVPQILHQAGMLSHLYTDLYASKKWLQLTRPIPRKLYPKGLKRLLGRKTNGVPAELMTTFPGLGLRYKYRQMTARNNAAAYAWAGMSFGQAVMGEEFPSASGVYVFSSAGLEILQFARNAGMRTFLEQPNLPQSFMVRLLGEEHKLHPNWEAQPTINRAVNDYAARERQEWELADLIICGSQFVCEAVKGVGGNNLSCAVVPYGVDFERNTPNRSRPTTPLRVLTVGNVGLRKGIPYLLEAAKLCKQNCEFRAVGPVQISRSARNELAHYVDLVGAVPRSEIRRHYDWADVFVLPSICEGSATVCYEALACGLPIICTPNTGSIVRDGLDGYIVPIREPKAIASRLKELARNPDLYAQMAKSARLRYETEGSIGAYAKRLVSALSTEVQ